MPAQTDPRTNMIASILQKATGIGPLMTPTNVQMGQLPPDLGIANRVIASPGGQAVDLLLEQLYGNLKAKTAGMLKDSFMPHVKPYYNRLITTMRQHGGA